MLFAGDDNADMETRVEIKEINWSSNNEDTFSFPCSLDYIIASGTDRRMWTLIIMPLTVVYFVVLANACVPLFVREGCDFVVYGLSLHD